MKDAFEFEFMHGTHRWSIFFKSLSNPIKGHLEEGKKKKKHPIMGLVSSHKTFPIPFQESLQNAGLSGCVFLGRVFKNAAQNSIKPRFLKTGLKGARPRRVLYATP